MRRTYGVERRIKSESNMEMEFVGHVCIQDVSNVWECNPWNIWKTLKANADTDSPVRVRIKDYGSNEDDIIGSLWSCNAISIDNDGNFWVDVAEG